MDLLNACKLAYRKHHLNDESIGWEELGDCLLDALCNEMGDDGFQEWLSFYDYELRKDCLRMVNNILTNLEKIETVTHRGDS